MEEQVKGFDLAVDANQRETTVHGSLDYPVSVYRINMDRVHAGYMRWHWHEELELVYIAEGLLEVSIQNATQILSQGDIFFVNRDALHCARQLPGQPCILYSILFHVNYLFGYEHSYLANKYLLPIVHFHNQTSVFPLLKEKHFPHITEIVTEIIRLSKEKPFAYEIMTKDLLLRFWLELLDFYQGFIVEKTDDFQTSNQLSIDEERVKSAVAYIAGHYDMPITLEDIAAAIHVSKSECCRCFKRCLKMSPFDYLLKYRIYTAVDMITNNPDKLSVSQIAAKTGFNSSSYFNKTFRKYMKCTPSEYKKNHANKVSPQIHRSNGVIS